MKGYLLAGCAAVALVGACGAASAQTAPGKFDIKLSGDAYFTAGAVDQQGDPSGMRTVDFTNRFRLQITPTAKADNGIEYGANLRIRAWNGTGVIDADQAYIFTGGTFGRIEAGLNAGPNNQYGVTAPSGFGTGGVVGDWSEGPGSSTWLNNQLTFLEPIFGGGYNNVTNTNWATRINYFTPRFFSQGGGDDAAPTGLMGMLSFAPTNTSVNTNVTRNSSFITSGGRTHECSDTGATAPIMGCGYQNVVEVGLRYDGSFNGVSISASAGFERGDSPDTNTIDPGSEVSFNELSAYQAGLQLGYAGVLVGASYLNAGKSGYAKGSSPAWAGTTLYLSDQSAITAGISYETGPVVVGFNYAHGEDAGDIFAPGSRTANLYSIGATYTVAPGLTTAVEYLRSETNNEAGYGTDPIGGAGAASGNANLFLWKSTVTF